jgi:hypothetical protein
MDSQRQQTPVFTTIADGEPTDQAIERLAELLLAIVEDQDDQDTEDREHDHD